MAPNSSLDKSSLVNHKLHIILSIFSLGGWLPVYAVYYLFRKSTDLKFNEKNVVEQLVKNTYFRMKRLGPKQKILLGIVIFIIFIVGTFADDNAVTITESSTPITTTATPTPTPTPTLNNETAAGTEVIISDIKNKSDFDGVSWYWAAAFKTNTAFLTKTDCVVIALNESGEVIGETRFRGTTAKDGTVMGGAETSVDTTKAKALSIKNFDIRCTIAAAPKGEATFSISISRWQVVNPASGYAIFTIRNVGKIAGEPICRIIVEDESGTFKGTGFIIGVGVIEPGAKYQGKKLLTIKKQGASYVSQSRGYCN